MQRNRLNILQVLIAFAVIGMAVSEKDVIKLSFEVENKEEFCVYHRFNDSIEYKLEYGVLKGGNFDIDFNLESPNKKMLYEKKRVNKKDEVKFHSSHVGEFKFCFSNNFSPLTHKVVYFNLQPNDARYQESLREEAGNVGVPGVMSATEFRLNNIHTIMNNVTNIQRFYRTEELIDRNFADMLNFKINALSCVNFATILFVSIIQVNVLKCLFHKKQSINYSNNNKNANNFNQNSIRTQVHF